MAITTDAPSLASATVPVPVATVASSPPDAGTATNTTTTKTLLSFLFSVIAVGLAVAALGVAVKKDSSLSKPAGPSTCSNLHWAGLFQEDGWLGGVAFSGEGQLVEWEPELTPDYGEGDISLEETVRCGLSELQYTILDRYQKEMLVASGPEQEPVDALRHVELCTIRAWKSNEMLCVNTDEVATTTYHAKDVSPDCVVLSMYKLHVEFYGYQNQSWSSQTKMKQYVYRRTDDGSAARCQYS